MAYMQNALTVMAVRGNQHAKSKQACMGQLDSHVGHA